MHSWVVVIREWNGCNTQRVQKRCSFPLCSSICVADYKSWSSTVAAVIHTIAHPPATSCWFLP